MIWNRTPAGLVEMKRAALIHSPVMRNLLMVIDGAKSEEMLLKHLIGIKPTDFHTLHQHGLIQPAQTLDVNLQSEVSMASVAVWERSALAAALARLISTYLGFSGLVLASSVQRARTVVELLDLARTVVTDVEKRMGADAAGEVRATIFGNAAG